MILLSLLPFLCLLASPTLARQEVDVTIDTLAELGLVEGTAGTCYYRQSDVECKGLEEIEGRTGFWSSCEQPFCEISISLGKIGNNAGQVPTRVGIVAYVQGDSAEIRARYRFSPGSPTVNINPPIGSYPDWTTTWFDLTTIPVLTPESEFVIRLTSAPQDGYIDVLDKIIFTIEGEEETTETPIETTEEPPTTEPPTTEPPTTEPPTTEPPTTEPPTTEAPTTESPTTEAPTTEPPTTEAPTTEPPTTEAPTTEPPTTEAPTTEPPTTEPPTTDPPTTTTTTPPTTTTTPPVTQPPGPIVTIDTSGDLNLVGTPGICAYVVSPIESCKWPLPPTDGFGFWSSCRIFNCEITIRVGNLGNLGRTPREVKVVAFVHGPGAPNIEGNIEVRYRLRASDPVQSLTPSITPGDDWTTTAFDLSRIVGFNPDSEIIFRLASDMNADYVDVLDKLIFTFPIV